MGSLGLFLQCITSIFFSTIMDRMVKQFGTRAVYLASVVFFPVAAFVMCLSHSVIVVTISAALTGFTFSALQILPYTLASLYHHDKQVGGCPRGRGSARWLWDSLATLFCHLWLVQSVQPVEEKHMPVCKGLPHVPLVSRLCLLQRFI